MTASQSPPEPVEGSALDVARLDFAVAPTRVDGQTPVTVAGELDHGSHAALLHELSACIAAGRRRLLLDMSGVTFCDSTGLAVLVRLHKRAETAGGTLVLRSPVPRVHNLLTLTCLTRLFSVE